MDRVPARSLPEHPGGQVIPLYRPDVHVEARRLGAVALDLLVLGILQIWVGDVFGVTRVTGGSLLRTGGGYAYVTTATTVDLPWLILLAVAYFALLEGLFGATWGKLVAGLRVVTVDGARPTPVAVLTRNVLRVVDAWPFVYGLGIVGSAAALLSPRRQRLGDRLAGTLVVRAESAPLAYRPLSEVRRRLLLLGALAALSALVCLGFSYYGRPPLVIAGLVNTDQLVRGQSIATYSLGAPRWGHSLVTYPISYTLSPGARPCHGLVTLRWSGFFSFHGGWVLRTVPRRCG